MEYRTGRFYERKTLENLLSREKNAAEDIYTPRGVIVASWLASMLTSEQSKALTDPFISSHDNNNNNNNMTLTCDAV